MIENYWGGLLMDITTNPKTYDYLHLHFIGQTEFDGYVTLRWMCGLCMKEIEDCESLQTQITT
jgi:hypothetical protein